MNPKMIDSILQKHLSKKYILKSFIPYNSFISLLDVRFVKENGSYISILPFRPDLIGNLEIQALHGGVTLSLLELTAFLQIQMEQKNNLENEREKASFDRLNTTALSIVDIQVDYLRPGFAYDSFSMARINRLGRRFASVSVIAWQKDYEKIFAQATIRFQISKK